MKEKDKNEGEKIATWLFITLAALIVIIVCSIISAIKGTALFIEGGGWKWLSIIAALLIFVYFVSHADGRPRE